MTSRYTKLENKFYWEISQIKFYTFIQWKTKKKGVNDYKIIIAELHQSHEIFEYKQHRRLPSEHAVLFSTQFSDISGNVIGLLSSKTVWKKNFLQTLILTWKFAMYTLFFMSYFRYLKQLFCLGYSLSLWSKTTTNQALVEEIIPF